MTRWNTEGPAMTKAQSLRHDAQMLDREARRLRRMAQRKAMSGLVFIAETRRYYKRQELFVSCWTRSKPILASGQAKNN